MDDDPGAVGGRAGGGDRVSHGRGVAHSAETHGDALGAIRDDEAVWAVITDFEGQVSWRPRLHKVERLPDRDGRPVSREIDSWGNILPIEVVQFEPPRRMVGRIADDSLPFGGTWTYEVTPHDGGSRVRITEDGEIRSAMFRYVARAGGYTGTIENHPAALGKRLGENAPIEP